MGDYERWIATKSETIPAVGVDPGPLGAHLFAYQADLVGWALRRGRAALFTDTGTGKTAMQIEWARRISEEGRVLVLAPLAVAEQTVREAARFGVHVAYRREDHGDPITITNYEILDRFDPNDFIGIVLDESSILKSFTGATRNAIIDAFRDTPFRLACTATPAPNDFTELGNHAEFLGVKSRVEMLAEYFTHDGGSTQDWRIKGHAVDPFWRWVCSWGAMLRMPSDLGYSDDGFVLPPMSMHEHLIRVDNEAAHEAGLLFAPTAATLSDQRAIRRATLNERVVMAADLAAGDEPALIWCELNAEADACAAAIPGAVNVQGSDSPEIKADRLLGFAEGRYRVLVSKPSIAGFGMNWQHCARVIFVGASHSYEQTYQAIRRCWRFGQRRPVAVHVLCAETEQGVLANYRRKEADAAHMGASMIDRMRDTLRAEIRAAGREWNPYNPTMPIRIPYWIGAEDTP